MVVVTVIIVFGTSKSRCCPSKPQAVAVGIIPRVAAAPSPTWHRNQRGRRSRARRALWALELRSRSRLEAVAAYVAQHRGSVPLRGVVDGRVFIAMTSWTCVYVAKKWAGRPVCGFE